MLKRLSLKHSLRIAVILVGYCEADTVESASIIDSLCKGFVHCEKILVWNKPGTDLPADSIGGSTWRVIIGSNVNCEFSGWQEGIQASPLPLASYDYVLFINDTLGRASSHARKSDLLIHLITHLRRKREKEAIGLLHCSNINSNVLEIDGDSVKEWLCTGCFALSSGAIAAIDSRIDYASKISHLISNADQQSILSGDCPRSTHEHITNWLTDTTNGWHNALPHPHSQDDLAALRRKATMILCELMLSAQLKRRHVHFLDPTHERSLLQKLFARLRHLHGTQKNITR